MTRQAAAQRWRARKKASIWFHTKRAINARRREVAGSKAAKRERKQKRGQA